MHCARFAQDYISFLNLQDVCKIVDPLLNMQYMRKIVLISPLRKIVLLPMRKIVLLSLMHNICARIVQDCTHNTVLLSLMRNMCNICTRLYFSSQCAIYALCKICARLHFIPQCARCVQDCTFSSI